MTIGAVLDATTHDVISVRIGQTVGEALKVLAERRIGAVPVLDGDTVVGIFSERDILYGLHLQGAALLSQVIDTVMTRPVITAASDMGVLPALSLMTQRRIRHLPVVDDGQLAGFISIGDLVKYRMDRIESEAEAMRDYIQSA